MAHGADGGLRRIARPPPAAQRRRQHGPAGCPGRRHGVHPRRHTAPEHEPSRPSSSRAATASPGTTRSSSTSAAGWPMACRVQSSYTLSKSEDTTQASTFFSDATNGTTSAMPEYIAGYNKGPSDFDTRHNWVLSFTLGAAVRQERRAGYPRARRRLAGLGHLDDAERTTADGLRHRQPIALAVEPVARPRDRPGPPELRARLTSADNAINGSARAVVQPAAFVLQPAGTFGNTGRGDFIGPNLRTLDLVVQQERPGGRARRARPRRVPPRGVQHR